jgi:enoyl-CoA hydratase/carnithine racemase
MKNAIGEDQNVQMKECFDFANSDVNTKVVVVHGGKYFSSGNDLTTFVSAG